MYILAASSYWDKYSYANPSDYPSFGFSTNLVIISFTFSFIFSYECFKNLIISTEFLTSNNLKLRFRASSYNPQVK